MALRKAQEIAARAGVQPAPLGELKAAAGGDKGSLEVHQRTTRVAAATPTRRRWRRAERATPPEVRPKSHGWQAFLRYTRKIPGARASLWRPIPQARAPTAPTTVCSSMRAAPCVLSALKRMTNRRRHNRVVSALSGRLSRILQYKGCSSLCLSAASGERERLRVSAPQAGPVAGVLNVLRTHSQPCHSDHSPYLGNSGEL